MKPKVLIKDQKDRSPILGNMIITPPIGEGYWKYKVILSDKQSIVAFPKFFTIGIGFEKEEDWNSNLPYTCYASKIFDHISHNKFDESITDQQCIEAIKAIQNRIIEDKAREEEGI